MPRFDLADERHRAEIMRFGRFLVVGVLNTAFGYSIYAVLVLIGVRPELALAGATILGVLFNYVTTGRLVFDGGRHGRLWRFAAVYAVIYGLNALLLRLFIWAGSGPLLAQALCLPITVPATFLALRRFVYRAAQQSPPG